MRGEILEVGAVVTTDALHCELEKSLSAYFGRAVVIDQLDRRLSQYSSSYLLEEVDVVLNDGTSLALIFKDMSTNAILEGATRVKPRFVYNPTREIDTYRDLLDAHRVGTAICYGAVVAPEIQRYWLFIERLPPVMLWQMGNVLSLIHISEPTRPY